MTMPGVASEASVTELKPGVRGQAVVPPDEPGAWMGVREAAEHLGLSERTLRRRIRAERCLSRLEEDGRRAVWVPGDAGHPSPDMSSLTPDGAGSGDIAAGGLVTMAERLLLLVQERSDGELARAEANAARSRRRAGVAWGIAAGLLILLATAVGVGAWLVGGQADDLADLRLELAAARSETDDARNQAAETARAASEAQGQALSMAAEVARLEAAQAAQRERADELLELLAQEQRRHPWTWPPAVAAEDPTP